jgi:amidase
LQNGFMTTAAQTSHALPADLTELDATALSEAIHARHVSCREVMQAYLQRIHAFNPTCNAIVNMAPDDALLAQADACDQELSQGHSRGWLHGIPQAIKDTGAVQGFPTTFGSVLLKDAVAPRDGVIAARMKAAGCIVIGKTNVPELALGSNTFNALFGTTPNAWDPTVTAGGSSGGAAVSLVHRLLPVADGSDFMGSLRNPAGWNHVFGLRPSYGRVPLGPGPDVWLDQLGTEGPLARTVRDLGRMLATQSGHDPRVPFSLKDTFDWPQPAQSLRGVRVGWLGNLNGYLATEDGVLQTCEIALNHMAREGAIISPTALGYSTERLWDCWLTWRRALTGPRVAALMHHPNAKDHIKPEAMWEYEHSLSLSYTDFSRASQTRTDYYHHMLGLFEHFDVLALPVAQVWPFPLQVRWPQRIGDRAMDAYHRWMECAIYATLAGLPAISMPAGFHPEKGWPMGIQLVGPAQGDATLLRIVAAYEASRTDFISQRPVGLS